MRKKALELCCSLLYQAGSSLSVSGTKERAAMGTDSAGNEGTSSSRALFAAAALLSRSGDAGSSPEALREFDLFVVESFRDHSLDIEVDLRFEDFRRAASSPCASCKALSSEAEAATGTS